MIDRWKTSRVLELMGDSDFIETDVLKKILEPITERIFGELTRLDKAHKRCLPLNEDLKYRLPEFPYRPKGMDFRLNCVCNHGLTREELILWLQNNSDLLQEFRRGGPECFLTIADISAEPIHQEIPAVQKVADLQAEIEGLKAVIAGQKKELAERPQVVDGSNGDTLDPRERNSLLRIIGGLMHGKNINAPKIKKLIAEANMGTLDEETIRKKLKAVEALRG